MGRRTDEWDGNNREAEPMMRPNRQTRNRAMRLCVAMLASGAAMVGHHDRVGLDDSARRFASERATALGGR